LFCLLVAVFISIVLHCDFLSCLSTGYPDLVILKIPVRIRLIQSDIALKNWLKSKMDYVITDHKKRITKSGSILSGLNLLKKWALGHNT